MSRIYSPTDIKRIVGISPVQLRDWRRRGFLDDIGQKEKRGERFVWTYDQTDLLMLSVAKIFIREDMPLPDAIDAAFDALTWVQCRIDLPFIPGPDLVAVWDDGEHVVSVRIDDLVDLSKIEATSARVIDIEKVVAGLPPSVVKELSHVA